MTGTQRPRASLAWYAGALVALLAATRAATAADVATLDSLSNNFNYCTVCHGAGVKGNAAIAAPSLVRIEPWYLADQLQAFRARSRGQDPVHDSAGAEMSAVARQLSDAQITALPAQLTRFAAESAGVAGVPITGAAANGKRLYQAQCAACHGAHAQGNPDLHAPDLARLNDWYIVASFRKFQAGVRGSAPDHPWSSQMRQIAASQPADFPINDVAAWLARQHTGKEK